MKGKPANAQKINNIQLIICVPKGKSQRKFEKHIEWKEDENTAHQNMWKVN